MVPGTLFLGYIRLLHAWAISVRERGEEGYARLEPIVTELRASPTSSALGALHIVLGRLAPAHRTRERLALAERAAALARAAPDEHLLVRAEHLRGNALLRTPGHLEDGLRTLEDMIALAESLEQRSPLDFRQSMAAKAYGWALNALADICAGLGDVHHTTRYRERALQVAERMGDLELLVATTSFGGVDAFNLGDWEQARAQYERAIAITEGVAQFWLSGLPQAGLGEVCLAEGRWDLATHHLQEAIAFGARHHDLDFLRLAHGALAVRELLAGQPDAALTRLRPLLDRPNEQNAIVTRLLALVAWAYLDLGDQRQADAAAQQAVARARAEHNRLSLIDALRVQALVALRHQG
jgi:tetratricopeptide (TPR) repeat protein